MIAASAHTAMSLYDRKDTRRAYYIRQLKKDGWNGDLGGWVRHPSGVAVHGWADVIERLARSVSRFALALRTPTQTEGH